MVDTTEVLLSVSWEETPDGWLATLVTASEEDGFHHRELHPGTKLEFEVTGARQCTGFATKDDGRHLCPEWNSVDGDRQCEVCRNRDYHRAYVEGRTGRMRDGEHSVYLAQCGDVVKVGVTRSSRLNRRWVEQGATFAAEIENGLTADEALDRETALSDAGLRERIRKTEKLPVPSTPTVDSTMADYGVDGEVVDVFEKTQYPRPEAKQITKTGRVVGEVRSVVGQVVEVDGQCVAVTPGLCIEPPKQTGLERYT